MFWIIFFIWLGVGLLVNVGMSIDKVNKQTKPELKKSSTGFGVIGTIGFVIAMIFGVGLFLWLLGCIWYFFCSGFLVFEDQPILDKIICGLISLLPLGCVIGLIAIACGWDPWRK